MLRVVFMGTPEFAVPALKRIHAEHTVLAVYTQPDRPVGRGLEVKHSAVKEEALKLGLPIRQPEKLTLPGEFEALTAFAPDVIVVVAYGQILKKNVLELPRLGCVNIHSSLLPRWRGAAPIQWAILSGDRESGVTTMNLVEKLDAGNILLQAKTAISRIDTAGTLHDRLAGMGAELISDTLKGLESATLIGRSQNESEVTYASKLSKEMEWLDPNQPADQLELRVRALNPWPGTSLWVSGKRLKVKKVVVRADLSGPPGDIAERNGMLLLATAKGMLELQLVQWDGKKEVDSGGFLNGLKGRGEALPLKATLPPAP
jgi:methionyl-tRNA formyltransferase